MPPNTPAPSKPAPPRPTPVSAKAAPVPAPIPIPAAVPEPGSLNPSQPPTSPAPVVVAPVVPSAAVTVAAIATPAQVRPRNPSFTWGDFRVSPDPIALEKMKPETQLRRARLTKYVKVIVGGCAALCLVALVRSAVAGEGSATAASDTASSNVVRQKEISPKQIVARSEELKRAPKRAHR